MRGGVVRGKAIPVSLSTTQGKEKERGLCLLVRRENRYKVDRQGRENGHIAVVAVALAAATAAGERKRKGRRKFHLRKFVFEIYFLDTCIIIIVD